MELEFHELEMRYGSLRARRRGQLGRLRLSLEEHGQQHPIVVVPCADLKGRYVVIDGHQRISALQQLGSDTVDAVVWELGESEALVLQAHLSNSRGLCSLEQGWLLAELQHRFGWSQAELSRRFLKSLSWVSRRLGLVHVLSVSIQEQIRIGNIPPQAAMKVLVPLARSDRSSCEALADAIVSHRLNSPEIQALYSAWRSAVNGYPKRL